ncbi:MAG: GGDEF domain-containing protein [Lachnospiraceae bacterium]|nr:GGDEF domain-containing protein [Lachnospiraceae bacterium]
MLKILTNAKNIVFLSTCLAVHLISLCFFLLTGSTSLAVINAISSSIYILLLITDVRNTDTGIVIAFFEILCFSLLSELLSDGSMGYMFFPLGMVAVIFYLASVGKKKMLLLQCSGIVTTIAVFIIDVNNITVRIGRQADYGDLRNIIILSNIVVALLNMLYVSLLYMEEQDRNRAALEYNINHDPLTGLYNRRYFYSQVRTGEEKPGKYAIALIDIDNFKKINDTYGHKYGDAALVSISRIMTEALSPDDMAVRWGGEEFVVFMPGIEEEKAYDKLSDILSAIRNEKITVDDLTITCTVTMGVAVSDDYSNYEKIIGEADLKLYEGKNSGKNRMIT